jgi:Carboxypeptidase regulatory-like domain
MKRVACGMLLVLLVCGSALAQSAAEGTIRGVVHDEQGGVLPGVTISATSPTVAGTFTAVSESDGSYRLLNLGPGEYTLTAELQGFSKYLRPGIIVRAGLNIGVDIVLKIGAVSETVQVTGESPMLEVQKPVQAVNISGDMQRALPLGTRKDFSEFLEVTPGVTARTFDQGTGGQVYMLRGSEIENHVVQVDGADMGSFRQGWAGLYVGLSTDSIEDTQVKTGGVDASAPLGVGVVINIATPSGTNKLRGAASAIYQNKSWNGNNAAAGGQSVYSKVFQPDVSLGGPIVKDRVFFFGAFRYADRETGIYRTAAQLASLAAIDPTFTPLKRRRSCHRSIRCTGSTSATSIRKSRRSRPNRSPSTSPRSAAMASARACRPYGARR